MSLGPAASAPPHPTSSQRRILAGILLLVAVAYAGLWNCDFLTFDDGNHIYENPVVKNGLGWAQIRAAFTTFPANLWVPLTWISLSLDVSVFGLNPVAMHLVNLALHLAATALLFRAICKLTDDVVAALIVALLFGVHPLNAESVAWVTERKNVLSAVFWMLSLGCYADYVRRKSLHSWWFTLAWYGCGLLAKPAVVTLPCVFLLLDFWPFKRIGARPFIRLIAEKLPFVVLAAVASLMTMKSQSGGGAVVGTEFVPFTTRLLYAMENWVWYLAKLAWPTSLCAYYEHPIVVPPLPGIISGGILLVITAVCVSQVRKRPQWLIGWLWYVGVLVPMIGFVYVGGVARADRFAYLPEIGIWLALAVSVSRFFHGETARKAMFVVGGVVLALAAITSRQVTYWENSISLFERALAVSDRKSPFALQNAALGHSLAGHYEQAARYYSASIQIVPDDADTWNSLGSTFLKWERFPQAMQTFEKAIQLRPNEAAYHFNAALALIRMNRDGEADKQLEAALALESDLPSAYSQRAGIAERRGDRAAAVEYLQRAIQLRPHDGRLRKELERLSAAPDSK